MNERRIRFKRIRLFCAKNLPSPTLGRKYENPLGGDFLSRRLLHQMISLQLLLLHLLNRKGLSPIERLLHGVS